MKTNILLLALVLLCPALAPAAPNGTILQRETIATPAQTNCLLERIVYASGGLEVEAYLAQPLTITEPLPCVLRLRGVGREEFGGAAGA